MADETVSDQGAQCLFCAIENGQIPSYKVYDDNYVIAALDIKPANPGHLIVFPKKHYVYLNEMPLQEMAHLMSLAGNLIPVLMKALGVSGVNMLYSAGPAAGQRTPHLSIHLIPRKENDGVALTWKPKELTEEQFRNVQKQLIETLSALGASKSEKPLEASQTEEPVSSQPPGEKPAEKKQEEDEYYDISDSPAKYW